MTKHHYFAVLALLSGVGCSTLNSHPVNATTSTTSSPTTAVPSTPAQSQPPAPPARGPSLLLALEAAQKAVEACSAIEQKVSVSVIDSGGVLKALIAADGASARGVQSSTNKAITALTFGTTSAKVAELAKTDSQINNKLTANPNFNTRAGGVLITVGSDVIGAIGVGGARGSEKDEACALAGLNHVRDRLR